MRCQPWPYRRTDKDRWGRERQAGSTPAAKTGVPRLTPGHNAAREAPPDRAGMSIYVILECRSICSMSRGLVNESASIYSAGIKKVHFMHEH